MPKVSTPTPEEVQQMLDRTDWTLYTARVRWGVRQPSCRVYNGETLCINWEHWLKEGRALYSSNREYASKVRKKVPSLRSEDLTRVLRDLSTSSSPQ